MVPASAPSDGRVRRGLRTRAAIVDALLALLDDGDPRPSARAIAARAGVSLRSVFQHFDDIEALYAECVARQQERVAPLLGDVDPDLPLEARVDALVTQRTRLYERIGPVRRAARRAAPFSAVLRAELERSARALRAQLRRAFACELGSDDDRRLAAAELATSFDAWDQLRNEQRRSVADAQQVVRELLQGVLG